MSKQALHQKLDKVANLAKGSRQQRLAHRPFNYLTAAMHRKIMYPLEKKGKLVKTATFWGDKMMLLLPAGTDIYLTGGKTHDSELRLSRYLIQHMSQEAIFVDAGAHFGFYSLLASHLLGEQGTVISIEASPSIYNILRMNSRNNQNITSIHAALLNQDKEEVTFTEFPLLYSEYNSLHAQQFVEEEWYKNIEPQEVLVKGHRLDTLFQELQAVLPELTEQQRPVFVKIDVEGAEHEVLQGLSNLLDQTDQRARFHLLVEYWANSDQQQSEQHQQATALLRSKGFVPHLIDEQGNLEALATTEQLTDSENLVFIFQPDGAIA